MPNTPVYSLPFESPPNPEVNAEPGITLHGGSAGNDDILAEAVETELERIDGDISDVQDAFDTRPGWHTLYDQAYTSEGTELAITSGLYDMIRIHLYGSANPAGQFVGVSINDDQTPSLHERSYVTINPDNGVSGNYDDAVSDAGTMWQFARWSGTGINTAVATIFGTDGDNELSYIAEGYQFANSTSFRRRTLANGQLASARTLSSLAFYVTSTSDFNANTRVIVEGHRPPS